MFITFEITRIVINRKFSIFQIKCLLVKLREISFQNKTELLFDILKKITENLELR